MNEPTAAVFVDFGGPVTLLKADGSASFVTVGVYDEASIEHETDRGTMTSRQPEITVPRPGSEAWVEGDRIEVAAGHIDIRAAGKTFEILDVVRDAAVSTYTLSEV